AAGRRHDQTGHGIGGGVVPPVGTLVYSILELVHRVEDGASRLLHLAAHPLDVYRALLIHRVSFSSSFTVRSGTSRRGPTPRFRRTAITTTPMRRNAPPTLAKPAWLEPRTSPIQRSRA